MFNMTNKEFTFTPLKHFLKCDTCNTAFTGYEEKRKNYITINAIKWVANATGMRNTYTKNLLLY